MNLVSVYDEPSAPDVLWQLLAEREPWQSISHKKMPTRAEHEAFIASRPYAAWYCVQVGSDLVGAAYLTDRREVGIGILRKHRGHGYGVTAVTLLMRRHPGPLLANVNPANDVSMALFQSIGFRHVQNTLALETT